MTTTVTENEHYICIVDKEYKDKDGAEFGYCIKNKEYDVVEARVDSLSQAHIYMHQMNELLIDNKWRELVGLAPDEVVAMATVHKFLPPDTTQ